MMALFNACFRIAKELGVPIVLENVKGAQPWVGRAKANYGSYYLWGDIANVGGRIVRPDSLRVGAPAVKAAGSRKVSGVKVPGNDTFKVDGRPCGKLTDPRYPSFGTKQAGLSGPAWFNEGAASVSSKSDSRKAASALIAEIPYPLAAHIARIFKP